MDKLIKNGTVVTASGQFCADVAISEGKIIEVAQNISPYPQTEVIDAHNHLVLPGAVDAHVHLCLPIGNIFSSDDFYSGTVAAACGGVTTIFDYTNQDKGQTLLEAGRSKEHLVEDSVIDYAFHTGIYHPDGDLERQMSESAEYGITSFKVFTVYDMALNYQQMYDVFKASAAAGVLVEVHAENKEMLDINLEKFALDGTLDAYHHYLSRNEQVEASAVKNVIEIARQANAPVFIVHLACGTHEIEAAKKAGARVYAETCPQYLAFTSDVYRRDDARNFVCSPPIKDEKCKKSLWRGIKNGTISTVATDHCPFTLEQKAAGTSDFRKIPNGVPGIELSYRYMLSAAARGEISYSRAVELCCKNPATIFGVPQKSGIKVGNDADIVLFNPNGSYTASFNKLHSANDYTIWEGTEFVGEIEKVFSRGELVAKNGEFLGKRGAGRRLKCGLPELK